MKRCERVERNEVKKIEDFLRNPRVTKGGESEIIEGAEPRAASKIEAV